MFEPNELQALSIIQRHTKVLQYGKEYHVCFLYHRSDQTIEWIRGTASDLEDIGLICYYKDRNMLPGEYILRATLQCLRKSVKIVIVLNKKFIESKTCLNDLYYAIHENLSRDENDNPNALIPIRLELCDIPEELCTLKALDIFDETLDWWHILVKSIDSQTNCLRKFTESSLVTSNALENAASALVRELKNAETNDLNLFLARPIALNLCHFLNQGNELRSFHLAMETLGIEVCENIVSFTMNSFKDFASKPYQIAHIFKQNIAKMPDEIKSVKLIISDASELISRNCEDEVHQFNKIVRTVLKARSDHLLTGIMYDVEGIPKTRDIRDKCRFLIHDAVVEEITDNISNPKYASYEERLTSFKRWPKNTTPTKEQFAEAGYFCEENDVVLRCFHCNGVDWDFKPYEDPWRRHAKWYYNCPFVKSNKSQEFITNSRFGKSLPREMYNPRYEKFYKRLVSFQNWPHGEKPHALKMADSGLYFTRLEDKACCFHCGHGFRNWTKEMDPWFRHALMSPNCEFVHQYKSDHFLINVEMERKRILVTEKCSICYTIKGRKAL